MKAIFFHCFYFKYSMRNRIHVQCRIWRRFIWTIRRKLIAPTSEVRNKVTCTTDHFISVFFGNHRPLSYFMPTRTTRKKINVDQPVLRFLIHHYFQCFISKLGHRQCSCTKGFVIFQHTVLVCQGLAFYILHDDLT